MSASKEYTFKDNLELFAERYSANMQERFAAEVKAAKSVFPKDLEGSTAARDDAIFEMLNTYIVCMFETAVAISSVYASSEVKFEENIVEIVKNAFVKMRKMKEDGLLNEQQEHSNISR